MIKKYELFERICRLELLNEEFEERYVDLMKKVTKLEKRVKELEKKHEN